jgi:hypothetical protein
VHSLARYGTSEKRPPFNGRTVPKCRRSSVAIVRVLYRSASTTLDASARADLQVGIPLDDLDRRRQIVTVERRNGPSATGEISQHRKLGRDAFARRDKIVEFGCD